MRFCRLRNSQKSWKARSDLKDSEKAGRETVSLPAFAVRWRQDCAWGDNSSGMMGWAVSSFARWISAVRPHPALCFSAKSIEPPSPTRGRLWQLPDEPASFAVGTAGMERAFPYAGEGAELCEADEVEDRGSAEVYTQAYLTCARSLFRRRAFGMCVGDGGFVFCPVDIRCSTSSGSLLFSEKQRTTFPCSGEGLEAIG